MRVVLFLLALCQSLNLVFAQISTQYTNETEFRMTALTYTNAYRSQHGVPFLIWNAQLATYAQDWTDQCKWAHSVRLD